MTDDKNFVEDLLPGAFADALASKPHVAGGWNPINVHSDIVDTLRDPSLSEATGVDSAVLQAAVAEIKRLRADLKDWRWASDDATGIVERLPEDHEHLRRRNKRLADEIERLRALVA